MRKIKIYLLILSLFSVFACTKERLIITEKELQFDENSPEYQTYQAERAMEYIRMYRFEKLGDVLSKLNDPAVRKNLQDSLRKYRSIAETQALYVVTPLNDSLFFIPPENTNPTLGDEVWLGTNFLASYSTMPNAKGVVQGFKNYPKTTIFHFYNNLATEVKGVNDMPDLKIFRWLLNVADIQQALPNTAFEYVSLKADLSNNHKLQEINIGGIKLGGIIFPNHQLESFSNGRIFSAVGNEFPTGSLDGLWSKTIDINGLVDPDFKMTNVKSDSLVFSPAVKTLDISNSEIKKLRVPQVEKLVLNEDLKSLWMTGVHLQSKPTFPPSLEELEISDYELSDKDFSTAINLKKIKFNSNAGFENLVFPAGIKDITLSMSSATGSNAGISKDYSLLSQLKKVRIDGMAFSQTGLVFPPSLEQLSFSTPHTQGQGNYGNLQNLKIFEGQSSFEYMPLLPVSLTKLHMQFFKLTENVTIDIRNLTNLNYIYLYSQQPSESPITLILPTNLSEAAAKAPKYSVNGLTVAFYLPKGSTIVNKPSWFDQYVAYY